MPKIKISNYAGITATLGLAAIPVFLAFSPTFTTPGANAESSMDVTVAATVNSIISLTTENLSIGITPKGGYEVFKTGTINSTVSTNNETGYSLYFVDKDEDTSLNHTDLEDTAITSTQSSSIGEDMLVNTWGYTIPSITNQVIPETEDEVNNATNKALSYNPIPTTNTLITSNDNSTPGEVSKLTFGVKINSSTPPGEYSDEIVISAVTNYAVIPEQKPYMQNWAGCSDLSEGDEVTLYDKRDDTPYTVTKINHSASASLCWMTQNLAIGGDEEMTLSKDLTDSSSDYILPGSSTSGFSDNGTAYAYIDSTYGGYYSWKAATAGTSPSSGEASASICPKGWRLPTKAEFDALKSYKGWSNSSGWTSGIFKGQLAGRYYNSSPSGVGSYGNYWSSTADSSDGAYRLVYGSSDASTSNNNKRLGYSVRCVSRS